MPGAARLNDANSGGSNIVSAVASTVFINGLPAALLGSVNSCHPPGGNHSSPSIVTASSTVVVEGRGLARLGDSLSCGHSIVQASTNVFSG